MISLLRKRATDQFGVVHETVGGGFNLLTTRCGVRGQWEDRDYVANIEPMTWDGFNPMPSVTCMTCLVKEARK